MRRFLKVVAIVVAALALLVALGPTILSTSFGRALAAKYLSSRAGWREVTIGNLDVGWRSGVTLGRLEIKERPGFGDTPFVKIARIDFPNPLFSLLKDGEKLNELRVSKPQVSIVRLADKRLSIADLVASEGQESGLAKPSSGGQEKRRAPWPHALPVTVEAGRLQYADKLLSTSVVLEELNVAALYDQGRVELTSCRARLNGGELSASGHADLREKPEPFDLAVNLKDAQATADLWGLGYLVPLLHNPFGKTSGVISFDLSLAGRGLAGRALKENLTGDSRLVVRDVRIEGSQTVKTMVSLLGKAFKLEHDALTLDELTAPGRIARGRVTSDEIRAAHGQDFTMRMSGHTTFDGQVSYRLSVSGAKIDKYLAGINRYLGLKLGGTLSKPKFSLGSALEDSSLIDSLLDAATKKAQ